MNSDSNILVVRSSGGMALHRFVCLLAAAVCVIALVSAGKAPPGYGKATSASGRASSDSGRASSGSSLCLFMKPINSDELAYQLLKCFR